MSLRIILASVLGLSVLCSSVALAQTGAGAGGGNSGTSGGSMGSSMGSGGGGWHRRQHGRHSRLFGHYLRHNEQ